MNIDRFKNHHVEILSGIAALRKLAHQGVADHAVDIAHNLKALSQVVTQHLAVEDRILYPSLERSGDERMAGMSRAYQNDMHGIASAFINFARRWGNATLLTKDPDGFRTDANVVLKNVHARMMRENREFYPAIEAL
ncbi:hemerythrin domain-containing protein [Castellaniella sp. MT123]|uniref:hemerythrin domain-containing protein n=1 Tax=Castellaniella sp. MT123 TaxID=3140381 RepID=UPI0031F3683F|nr:hemerythrin domain-containing protein [Castellaniella sp.]